MIAEVKEKYLSRIIIIDKILYGFDMKASTDNENGDVLLKFTHNITEAYKYKTVEEAKAEPKLSNYENINNLTVFIESDNGEDTLMVFSNADKIKQFMESIHIAEVQSNIGINNIISIRGE